MEVRLAPIILLKVQQKIQPAKVDIVLYTLQDNAIYKTEHNQRIGELIRAKDSDSLFIPLRSSL
jgi:hypothetical protein